MNGSIEMNKSMKRKVNLAILYWRILAIMHNPWTKYYIMQRGVTHDYGGILFCEDEGCGQETHAAQCCIRLHRCSQESRGATKCCVSLKPQPSSCSEIIIAWRIICFIVTYLSEPCQENGKQHEYHHMSIFNIGYTVSL